MNVKLAVHIVTTVRYIQRPPGLRGTNTHRGALYVCPPPVSKATQPPNGGARPVPHSSRLPSSDHSIRLWLLSKQNRTQYSSPCCEHYRPAAITPSLCVSPPHQQFPQHSTCQPLALWCHFSHSRRLCHPLYPGVTHLPRNVFREIQDW